MVAPSLPSGRGHRGRPPAHNNRTVVDALLWLARAGAGWRSLPARYGPWNSVRRRVSRWGNAELLDALRAAPATGALGTERLAAIRAAVPGRRHPRPAPEHDRPRRVRLAAGEIDHWAWLEALERLNGQVGHLQTE